MNGGIEILIQRLKDCPEDFVEGKWARLLGMALGSSDFTSEDKDALIEAVSEKNRNAFTERVMKTLAGEDEESDEGKSFISQPSGMVTGFPTLVGSSGATGTWGNSVASQMQMLADRYRYSLSSDDQDNFKQAMKLDMSVEEYVRTHK